MKRDKGRFRNTICPAFRAGIFLCLFLGQMGWGLGLLLKPAEARGEALSHRAKHTALSLRVLSQEASAYFSPSARLPGGLSKLCGITRLRGFLIDDHNQDVVLFGEQIDGDAPLHLDDLVVAMRSVWGRPIEPVFASLDPREEHIAKVQQIAARVAVIQSPDDGRQMIEEVKRSWGAQMIRVGGVPRNSRFAHVMINADYHMKQVSLGAQKLSGLPSLLDIRAFQVAQNIERGNGAIPQGPSFNRFWFAVEEGYPTLAENEGIVWVTACPVRLLTEKQIGSVSGGLFRSEEEDPGAVLFAEQFSEKFPWPAGEVPAYGDLRNLYLLKAVLEAMRFRQAIEKVNLAIDVFLDQYACKTDRPMPDSLEGRVLSREVFLQGGNGNVTHWHFPVTFGGVSMEMKLRENSSEINRELGQFRYRVLQRRPSAEALSW